MPKQPSAHRPSSLHAVRRPATTGENQSDAFSPEVVSAAADGWVEPQRAPHQNSGLDASVAAPDEEIQYPHQHDGDVSDDDDDHDRGGQGGQADESAGANATSSQGSDGSVGSDDDDEDESEEELGPRELPERATRGCRIRNLIGQAALEDAEFWNRTQWVEEEQDEEWSTEDEKHYRDEYDSDFDRGTTDEEEGQALADAALEARLDKEEAEQRKKGKAAGKHVYVDPRSWSALRAVKGSPELIRRKRDAAIRKAKALAAKRPKPPPPAVAARTLGVAKGIKATDGSLLTQEAHLKIAKMTEVENTQTLQRQVDEELWKKTQREEKAIGAAFKGKSELLVSWSSDRLLENEQPFDGPTHCRDILFFINFDQPAESAIPSDIYTSTIRKEDVLRKRREATVAATTMRKPSPVESPSAASANEPTTGGTSYKYRDPVTLKPFSSVPAFLRLRRKTLADASVRIGSRLAGLDRLLSATLELMNSPAYDQASAAREALKAMQQLRHNLLDPHLTKKTIKSLMAVPSSATAVGARSESEGGSSADATPAAAATASSSSAVSHIANNFINLFERPGMDGGGGDNGTTLSTPLTSEDDETRLHMSQRPQPQNNKHPRAAATGSQPVTAPPMPRKRGRPPKPADSNAPKQRSVNRQRKDASGLAAAVDPTLFQQQQHHHQQQQLLHMHIAAMANSALYAAARQPLRGGGPPNEMMLPPHMWMQHQQPQPPLPWANHQAGFAIPPQYFPPGYMFPFQQPQQQLPSTFNFPPGAVVGFPMNAPPPPMGGPPMGNSLPPFNVAQHHHMMMVQQPQQQQSFSPASYEHTHQPQPPSSCFGYEQQPPPSVG